MASLLKLDHRGRISYVQFIVCEVLLAVSPLPKESSHLCVLSIPCDAVCCLLSRAEILCVDDHIVSLDKKIVQQAIIA